MILHSPAGLPLSWWWNDQAPCGLQHVHRSSRVLRDLCAPDLHGGGASRSQSKVHREGPGWPRSLCPANGSFCATLLMSCSPNTAREQESRFHFTLIFFFNGDLNTYLILWLWNKGIISARILGKMKKKENQIQVGVWLRLFSSNSKTSVQRR